jgi:hypothetical protein
MTHTWNLRLDGYHSTLKMEAAGSSETSSPMYQNVQRQ